MQSSPAASHKVSLGTRARLGFIRFNQRLCDAITPGHFDQTMAYHVYHDRCIGLMARADITRVLDVGAGKTWPFERDLKSVLGLHLTGLDISADEMNHNDALDDRVVCDVTTTIPMEAESVDLITARAGIEHFSDNDRFLANCHACLRPGGYFIATFPNKFAPFAILNRILPHRVSRVLLRTLIPGSEGILGFKAYYDRACYTEFTELLEKRGFSVEYYYPSYFSSAYFRFAFPLYVLSLLLDLSRFAFGIKNFSSYNLFVAKKASAPAMSPDL